MAIYTGVADGDGNFTIPFSTNYNGGQKVTVTAEKDASIKSIELFAPSEVIGEAIKISGNWNNFPANIGKLTISMTGTIQTGAFWSKDVNYGFSNANGLEIFGVSSISNSAFFDFRKITTLLLDSNLITIGTNAFQNALLLQEIFIPDSVTTINSGAFAFCSSVKKLTLGSSLSNIIGGAFSYLTACDEIICKRATPPSIASNTFDSLKSTCVIKVPAASLTAYQTAANWSVHASKMIGV